MNYELLQSLSALDGLARRPFCDGDFAEFYLVAAYHEVEVGEFARCKRNVLGVRVGVVFAVDGNLNSAEAGLRYHNATASGGKIGG